MKKRKQVDTNVTVKTVLDKSSGEILSQTEEHKTKLSFSEKEPNYVKLYLDDMSMLENLSVQENSILRQILKLVNYDNEVVLIKHIRQTKINPYIKTTSKDVDKCVKNAISKFKKNNIFFSVGSAKSGVYKLNPFLFGKGSWQDIKGLRLTIEYTEQGKITQVEEIER